MRFPAGLQSLAHKRVLRRECGRRGPMWPATHSRPHRSAEQSKDWTPDLLSHPAVPSPRRPSNSAGVGRGTEGETPVAQHPHLHAQHLWVPAPTCPPARHRPDISTSPHSPPASPGLALQPTHSSSASLCSEEPRSSSQSPFCLGEAGKGEEGAGAGRRSQQISPCVALDKSGISLRADRGLDDGLDVLEQGEDADKWGKTERGQ